MKMCSYCTPFTCDEHKLLHGTAGTSVSTAQESSGALQGKKLLDTADSRMSFLWRLMQLFLQKGGCCVLFLQNTH